MECKECKRLVEKHGKLGLNSCEDCGHYYKGFKCSCSESEVWEKIKEVEK